MFYCILFTSFKPWQDIAEILQIVAKHQSFNQEILLFNRNQIEPKEQEKGTNNDLQNITQKN
jgi:hypothetical protein